MLIFTPTQFYFKGSTNIPQEPEYVQSVLKLKRTGANWQFQDKVILFYEFSYYFEFILYTFQLFQTDPFKKNARRLYLEARGLLKEDEPSPPPSSDEDILRPVFRKSKMRGRGRKRGNGKDNFIE